MPGTGTWWSSSAVQISGFSPFSSFSAASSINLRRGGGGGADDDEEEEEEEARAAAAGSAGRNTEAEEPRPKWRWCVHLLVGRTGRIKQAVVVEAAWRAGRRSAGWKRRRIFFWVKIEQKEMVEWS